MTFTPLNTFPFTPTNTPPFSPLLARFEQFVEQNHPSGRRHQPLPRVNREEHHEEVEQGNHQQPPQRRHQSSEVQRLVQRLIRRLRLRPANLKGRTFLNPLRFNGYRRIRVLLNGEPLQASFHRRFWEVGPALDCPRFQLPGQDQHALGVEPDGVHSGVVGIERQHRLVAVCLLNLELGGLGGVSLMGAGQHGVAPGEWCEEKRNLVRGLPQVGETPTPSR